MVEDIADQVTGALHEDRAFDDVTAALLPKTMQAKARIITREGMILCGRPWVEAVFVQLDAQVTLAWQGDHGDRFSENDLLVSGITLGFQAETIILLLFGLFLI